MEDVECQAFGGDVLRRRKQGEYNGKDHILGQLVVVCKGHISV